MHLTQILTRIANLKTNNAEDAAFELIEGFTQLNNSMFDEYMDKPSSWLENVIITDFTMYCNIKLGIYISNITSDEEW
jgi:hypothetical protein